MQIALGGGAGDGPATPPQAARRLGGVIRLFDRRTRRRSLRRQCQEGARLGERGAERRRVRAVADDVEQVAVLAGGHVGELAGRAGSAQADEERTPAGAVEVAADPVAALAAAVGQILAANLLGARGERRGDGGGGRRIVLHAKPPSCGTPDTGRPSASGRRDGPGSGSAAREWGPTPRGREERLQNGIWSSVSEGAVSPAVSGRAPFAFSRNCTRPPGTSRISVEKRSESSPGFFQRRVWSLPAT